MGPVGCGGAHGRKILARSKARGEARGRVRVSFKAPWRSGTAHADMDAHQFLPRLCAPVPSPGFHMTRYYGVLASHHRLREHVIHRGLPAGRPRAAPATRPEAPAPSSGALHPLDPQRILCVSARTFRTASESESRSQGRV